MSEPLLKVEVHTDGGPWAAHNYPCPCCFQRHAVLDVGSGRMSPCWECQQQGWKLVKLSRFWRWLLS